MKIAATLVAFAALGAAAASPRLQTAQSDAPRGATPLRPVAPPGGQSFEFSNGPRGSAPDASSSSTPDELAESFRDELSLPDLDARMEAFDRVAEKAASDPVAREALESIAADTVDTELAFSARLALRDASRSTGRRRSSRAQARPFPADPFDSMRQQMDSIFGADPLFDDLFGADPFRSRGLRRPRIVDPFSGTDPFESMRRQLEQMQRDMDAFSGRPGSRTPGQRLPGQGWTSRSSGMSVQLTPDGIRVELTEDNGDGPETKVYEAPSKDALLEAHPELKDKLR